MSRQLPGPLELARLAVQAVVAAGEVVVDATAGNGHDTLFLAGCTGPGGLVYAFDIQAQALENTAARLEAAGIRDRVVLKQTGHEKMAGHVRGPVAAVMFNLGYLPGGDHRVVTRPETTVAALEQAAGLLKPGGIITIVVYRDHAGGLEESRAVDSFSAGLEQKDWDVARVDFPNRRNFPPYIILIQKRGVFAE